MKGKAKLTALLVVLLAFAALAVVPTQASEISIGNISANQSDIIKTPIRIDNVTNLGSADLNLTYNPSVVMVVNITRGDFDFMESNLERKSYGFVRIGALQTANPGLNGSVIFAWVTFKAAGNMGEISSLNISVNALKDATPQCKPIPYTVNNGLFTIIPSYITETSISLSANPKTIKADGISKSTITACLKTNGNPVANGTEVNFSTTLGSISPARAYTTNGIVTTVLTSSTSVGTAVVTGSACVYGTLVSNTVSVDFESISNGGAGRGRGSGGGAVKDTDGDGYSDIEEMIMGSDPKDPCDPNPECVACLAIRPATPSPVPKATPTVMPVEITPTPVAISTPTLMPVPSTHPLLLILVVIVVIVSVSIITIVLRRR